MVAAARVENNSTVAVEVTVEDKLAVSIGENAENRQETDFDCWVTAANTNHFESRFERRSYFAENVAKMSETFANMLRWESPAVKIFDTAIDAVVALLAYTAVVVDRKVRTTNRLATEDGSEVTA